MGVDGSIPCRLVVRNSFAPGGGRQGTGVGGPPLGATVLARKKPRALAGLFRLGRSLVRSHRSRLLRLSGDTAARAGVGEPCHRGGKMKGGGRETTRGAVPGVQDEIMFLDPPAIGSRANEKSLP